MDNSLYKDFLKKEYPEAYDFLQGKEGKLLFFPEPVSLPVKVYEQMQSVVKALFHLKQKEDYQNHLSGKAPSIASKASAQDSVLMAYDFHVHEGVAKLIEVNTNASGFLLVNSFFQFQNRDYKKALEDLKNSFQREWEKFHGGKTDLIPQKVILIDEQPEKQKMFLEFFMYKDFFKKRGWSLEICDSKSLKSDDKGFLYTSSGDKVDFVYNRSTDFYFQNHPHLEKSYLQRTCAFSPHPREYWLLADKNRLCDWFLQKDSRELKAISSHLLSTRILNESNKDSLWQNRKKAFFKIQQGYGGKLAYRGASLTRSKFDELCRLQSLVQEFVPPSQTVDSRGQSWKTDFRLYVYEDQVQQIVARCYQGQLTNFRQEGSGFAFVRLTK